MVFDKDGTLFDFQATWGVWCAGVIAELAAGDAGRPGSWRGPWGTIGTAGASSRTARSSQGRSKWWTRCSACCRASTRAGCGGGCSTARAAPQVETAPLRPLLDRLRGAGLTLGLATNDAEAPALAHLTRAGVLDRFAFVAGYDSGHGAKPGPGMLDAFCRATGLAPAACAMVGDSAHDLASGRAAGMLTIGVLTGTATGAALAPHADVVLADIAALPAWLGLPAE